MNSPSQTLFLSLSNTGRGGSPPSLVKLQNGNLALAYAVRKGNGNHTSRICVKFSKDEGINWSREIVLRKGGANHDIGYPRMVERPDGQLVVIYYWNHALQDEGAPYPYIAATMFDPDIVK